MYKKYLYIIIIAAIISTFLYLKLTEKNEWLCAGDSWVKRGSPSEPMPTSGCGQDKNIEPENNNRDDSSEEMIKITKPLAGEEISSPLIIEGEARGGWYFEANFPFRLEDENGQVLATGQAQAQGDWMTENFVPFKAQFEFAAASTANGKLILNNDNPSGLPENERHLIIPVKFKTIADNEEMAVKIFFNNNNLDPEITCTKVFPVERKIIKTEAVAKAAVEELLKGPSEEEKNNGYTSLINPGVKLNSVSISEGTIKVDFDKTIENEVGGSCRVNSIRAQIEETLKQFSSVNQVIISVDGRTEDILQP